MANLITKLKTLAALVLTLGGLAGGAGLAAYWASAKEQPVATDKKEATLPQIVGAKKAATKQEEERVRVDLHGDRLPKRAIARIGTTRFWPDDGHDGVARTITYTPDGKFVVSCAGKAVCFLEAVTGKEMRRLEIPGHVFHSFVFSPDGRSLATLGSRNPTVTNEICLWDVATLKEILQISEPVVRTPEWSEGVHGIAFTRDGKTFAVIKAGGVIRLWDVASWQEKAALSPGQSDFCHFLPDGKTLMLATDKSIRWWDISTAKEIRRQDNIPTRHRRHWAVSPDGERLAVLGISNVLHLLKTATGAETGRIALDSKSEICFCFSSDSQTLAYCIGNEWYPEDAETVFVAADTGRELRRWRHRMAEMAFAPDGKTVALESGYISIRNVMTGEVAVRVPMLPEGVMSVEFAPEGNALVACLRDGHISTWNPYTGKQRGPFQTPPKDIGKPRLRFVYATSFTADGKTAALVDGKGDLYVWAPATGKTLCRIGGRYKDGGYAVFAPDGKHLVVNDKNYKLELWNVAQGNLVRSLPEKFWWGRRVFSPDGRVLATAAHRENSLCLWEAATGKELRQLLWNDDLPANVLAFAPDGKRLVSIHSGSSLGFSETPRKEACVRLWDTVAGRELRCYPLPDSLSAQAAVVSPDGRTLATVAGESINLWELATGKERARFPRNPSSALCLAFSPDGRLLASGSGDHTALVWDVTGISPDGKLVNRDVQPEELNFLWSDLGGADAATAYRALWLLVAAQRQSVPLLAARLRPVPAISGERIARLISELDSEQFKMRNQAYKELKQLGELAEPALTKALAGKPSLDARQQIDKLLDTLFRKPLSSEQVHVVRAVEVLEHVATPEARQVLETLAKGAPGARLTNEVKASLDRLAKRDARNP